MEVAAVLSSSHCAVTHVRSVLERPGMVPMHNSTWSTSSKLHIQGLIFGGKIVASPIKQKGAVVSCLKASETTPAAKADNHPQGSSEQTFLRGATFPSGFEELILKVCDETQIAELKLKVGDFQMHVKRSIESTIVPVPSISPLTPPPIPSKPMNESAPASLPPSPPKSSTEKVSPFKNVFAERSAKLTALEASGSTGYVIVASPTVGTFRRGRTLKGKKQPPICKQGDVIKEGQVIGFIDQFGTELPVKSDVAGEVLKLLFDDGEALGYGDPLIAVLPSFHGIR